MIVVWLKIIHVTALSVWAGGILLMPILLGQRHLAGVNGPTLDRLHAFTRFAYISVISPAAFVAIGSGTALIFAREVFMAWFAIKLVFVGFLTALHVWIGLLVLSIFDDDGYFARWRVVSSIVVLCAVMTVIFWVVLAKPAVPLGFLPDELMRPGGLRLLAARFIPGLTP